MEQVTLGEVLVLQILEEVAVDQVKLELRLMVILVVPQVVQAL